MIRKQTGTLLTAAAVALLVTPVLAQGGQEQAPMTPEQKAEMEAYIKAGTPGEEVASTMMGAPFTGHGMTGFDNVTGKYWSTWNDSMSTGVMLSEGTCDAQKVCTFTGTWNDPIKKGP